MITFAIVPVKKFENSKSRLSSVLTAADKVELSIIMLKRTLEVLLQCDRIVKVIVVSSEVMTRGLCDDPRIFFLEQDEDSGVNSAVNLADLYCGDEGAEASVVIPIDLPLMKSEEIDAIISAGEKLQRGIIICPSQRKDGTNALFRRPPAVMPTQYDNNSFHEHLRLAKTLSIEAIIQTKPGITQDLDNSHDAMALINEVKESNPISAFLASRACLMNE